MMALTNATQGTTIYLENVEDQNPEVLAKVLEGIGSPKVRCCLDVGHAHFGGSNVPVREWVNVLGNLIKQVRPCPLTQNYLASPY